MKRPALTFLLLACAGACATDPDGLRLDLELAKATVARADSVQVTLTLSNVSLRPVSVLPAQAYGLCMHAYEVFDGQQREVSVNTALCAAALFAVPDPVALHPGQSMRIMDWWKPSDSWLDRQPLVPGTYQVRGRVSGDDRAIHSRFGAVTLLP